MCSVCLLKECLMPWCYAITACSHYHKTYFVKGNTYRHHIQFNRNAIQNSRRRAQCTAMRPHYICIQLFLWITQQANKRQIIFIHLWNRTKQIYLNCIWHEYQHNIKYPNSFLFFCKFFFWPKFNITIKCSNP